MTRTGKTSGTIALDQSLGSTILNYYAVSKTTTASYGRHNVGSSANVSTTITVLEVAKKYDISIDKKNYSRKSKCCKYSRKRENHCGD